MPKSLDSSELGDVLALEEANAWLEYLGATRGKHGRSYEDIEGWAWARLSTRLRVIKRRRRRVAA